MNILTLATDDGAFLQHIATYFNGNSDAEIQRWSDRLTRISEKLTAKTEARKDLSKLLESAREKETVFTDEEIRECYPFIRDNMPPHIGYPSLMAIIAGLSAERNRLLAAPHPSPAPQAAGAEMVSVGRQYLFVSPFGGGNVWREDSSEWNGHRPKASREIFAITASGRDAS